MIHDFCLMKSDGVIGGIVFFRLNHEDLLISKVYCLAELTDACEHFFKHPVAPSEVIKPHSQLSATGCCALGS